MTGRAVKCASTPFLYQKVMGTGSNPASHAQTVKRSCVILMLLLAASK